MASIKRFKRKDMNKMQTHGWYRVSLALLAGSLAGGVAPVAFAQSSASTLDEITVTARKKEESIMDSPLAVTALSATEINAAGFESIQDLAKVTPGLFFEGFETTPGRFDSVPFIRGVTFQSPSPIRQPVSVFVDGVFVAGNTAQLGIEDVQRVEIIKGPQSAQFGRATFAGAINYITLDPSDELTGKIALDVASKAQYELTGSIEGTLFTEGLTARLSGRLSDKEGHHLNALDLNQKLGDEETTSLGLTVVYEPNDAFKLRIRGFYGEIDDGPAAAVILNETFNTLLDGGIRPYLIGVVPDIPVTLVGQNSTSADFDTWITDARTLDLPYLVGEPDEFGVFGETTRFTADFSYDFGNLTLAGNVGANKEESSSLFDQDLVARPSFTLFSERVFDDTSAELRISGSALDDRLDWSVGYSTLEIDYDSTSYFGFQAIGQAVSFGSRANPASGQRLREVATDAVFGQFSFAFTDYLRVAVELRRQEDEITVRAAGNRGVTTSNGTFENTLPRYIVDFKPNDNSLFYASYSEGNLPGDFNTNFETLTPQQAAEALAQLPGVGPNVREETLENTEIGWKQTLMDGRASLAVALFQMDRVDQVTTAIATLTNPNFDPNDPANSNQFETQTLSVNSAATEINGLEVEGNLVSGNWDFRGTLAYTKAEVSAFPDSGNAGDYNFAFGNSDGFIGTGAPRYPDWQASVSTSYTAPTSLFGAESWFARGDLFYQDQFWLTTANLGRGRESVEVNLRAGLGAEKWRAELYVANLFDEDTPAAQTNSASETVAAGFAFTDVTRLGLRDERQVGLRASWNF